MIGRNALTHKIGYKMSILLFGNENKTSKPASQIIKETIGFENLEGSWFVTFQTIQDRKGYGRQRIPVEDFNEVISVLQDCVKSGIHKEDEVLTCSQVVSKSIVQGEDGTVRFKTEGTKGKKPTLFTSFDDFTNAVKTLSSIQGLIAEKAKDLK